MNLLWPRPSRKESSNAPERAHPRDVADSSEGLITPRHHRLQLWQQPIDGFKGRISERHVPFEPVEVGIEALGRRCQVLDDFGQLRDDLSRRHGDTERTAC